MKAKKVKCDILSWKPVILIPRGGVMYANPKETGIVGHGKDVVSDIKKLQKAKGLVNGTKNPVDAGLRGTLAYALMGITHDTTFGLSTSKQRKAYHRGELSLNYDATGPYIKKVKKYEKKGTVAPFVAFGYIGSDGKIKRDLTFPHLPTIEEALTKLHGKKPSGPMWNAFKNFLGIGVNASKAIALPKGTPDNIVAVYQKAVKQTAADPKFKKIAEKRFGKLPISFGKDAYNILKDATTMTPATRACMRKFIKNKCDVII